MRQFICLLILSTLFSQGYAQLRKGEVAHYLFPTFTRGTVLMKSGLKNETVLNYNSLTEEMVFEQNGKKLALGHLEQIDTVYVAGRKFFLQKDKFIEPIYHAKYDLYAEHKCDLKEPGKPAAYGGTSQTSSAVSYSSYSANGQLYELKLPEGFETNPYLIYWLKKEGKLSKFLNIRQLSKLFEGQSELFKKYVKENKISEKDPASVVALIKYLEEH